MPRLRRIGRVYYSDIRIGGKRIRIPLSTDRRAAEDRLADMVKERDATRYGHARADIPWGTFREKYMAYSKGSKAHWTQVRDESALRALEKFEHPNLLSDITPEVLERWKGARRSAGTGSATINRDMAAIKAMMKRAVLWGYVKAWDGSSVGRLKMTRGRLLFYSPAELCALLAVCRTYGKTYNFETMALLGARAGLRPAEICWLTWHDIDLARGVLSITPKPGWQPKDKEQRHIPVAADLLAHLRKISGGGFSAISKEYREKSIPTGRAVGEQLEWVIGKRPAAAVLSTFFRKLVKAAGLRGSMYTLRHTFASHLAQAGVSLYVIGELMGHSDPKQTMIYAHLQPLTTSDAIKRLPVLTTL